VMIRVREGRVVGREHRFLENLEEEADPAVLSAFLARYYVPAEDRARRVVVPFPPEDWDALRELLPGSDWAVPQRGTAFRWLELADANARHLLESLRIESFETEERAEDPVYALGRDLGLSAVPRSLICIDISHNQGRDTVGSLVWFEAGRPKKAEYRKFKIKGLGQQDDFAAIQEVVTRYLTRRREEAKPLPDLMVIDGGKGQLNAALEAAHALGLGDIPMVSLAKREEEVFLPGRPDSLRLPRRSGSLRLLQRARDEAHRFGLAYNRKRRTQRTITSELLNIPGVGPAKRRRLLERFGSLAGVRSASASELATVPGFSSRRTHPQPPQQPQLSRSRHDARAARRRGVSRSPGAADPGPAARGHPAQQPLRASVGGPSSRRRRGPPGDRASPHGQAAGVGARA